MYIITSHHPIHAPSNDMQMKRVNKTKQKSGNPAGAQSNPTHNWIDRRQCFSFQKIKTTKQNKKQNK